MYRYVLRRLLALIPVILAVIFIIYLILYLTPGDVATIILGNEYTPEAGEQVREELGLNRPFVVQYVDYIINAVQLDFGRSYISNLPVMDQIQVRFPNTLKLVLLSELMTVVVAIPIGVYAASKPYSLFSNITTVFAMLGIAMPIFWLGLLMILLFSVKLGWFPSAGSADSLRGLLLPAFTLALQFLAGLMRTTRSSMLEAINQDYVRTAKAKGVSRRNVIYKHAFRNALLPIINNVGSSIGGQLGGAAVTETVFSYAGMGTLMVSGINSRDVPTTLTCIALTAVIIGVSNLVVDIAFAFADPRIKAQYSTGR